MLYFGYKHALNMDDLWALAPRDQGANIAAIFNSAWEAQMQKQKYRSFTFA